MISTGTTTRKSAVSGKRFFSTFVPGIPSKFYEKIKTKVIVNQDNCPILNK